MSKMSVVPSVNVVNEAGELTLTCPYEVGAVDTSLVDLLVRGARRFKGQTVIAEKNSQGDYVTLTYDAALKQASAIAAQLIELGGDQSTPLMILSGASRAHFVVSWGAILAGVPYVPVSMNYSTVPGAFSKLRAVFDKTSPHFIWSEDFSVQQQALDETGISGVALVWLGASVSRRCIPLASELTDEAADQVQARSASLGSDSIARYMFTSGSTGTPKGVIHTHGMVTALLAARAALKEDDSEMPPRVLDWMPWSHVGAGVLRMAFVMNSGGAVYIDDGKPVPDQFHKTLANLKVVKPTSYAGAPLGWNMLVEALEQDPSLAETFFAHVNSLAYGSAAMPVSTYDRLQRLLLRYQGAKRSMSTSLMSTEVAVGLSRYWPCEDQTVVGLPMPGANFKLLPMGDRFEIRVKGPGVTPGYVNDPVATANAFDEAGYFKMGDAVAFVDPDMPVKGLRFAGRISEQFKLQSGTWVSAGSLRSQLLAACAPWVRDVVVCGINEAFLSLLVWPNLSACIELVPSDQKAVCASPEVAEVIRRGLSEHNAEHTGSAQRISRFLMMEEPPNLGEGEITEKGYVNQSLVQRRRSDLVAALYAEGDPRVWQV